MSTRFGHGRRVLDLNSFVAISRETEGVVWSFRDHLPGSAAQDEVHSLQLKLSEPFNLQNSKAFFTSGDPGFTLKQTHLCHLRICRTTQTLIVAISDVTDERNTGVYILKNHRGIFRQTTPEGKGWCAWVDISGSGAPNATGGIWVDNGRLLLLSQRYGLCIDPIEEYDEENREGWYVKSTNRNPNVLALSQPVVLDWRHANQLSIISLPFGPVRVDSWDQFDTARIQHQGPLPPPSEVPELALLGRLCDTGQYTHQRTNTMGPTGVTLTFCSQYSATALYTALARRLGLFPVHILDFDPEAIASRFPFRMHWDWNHVAAGAVSVRRENLGSVEAAEPSGDVH